MKKTFISFTMALAALLLGSFQGFSQAIPCPLNLDWELNDTTGWTAARGGGPGSDTGGVSLILSGQVPPTTQSYITTPYPGFVTGRHTITDATMPNDPWGHFPVVAPGGGNYSLKLGDDNSSNGAESVSFYINVPAGLNTYSINYMYAIVLNDPGHSDYEQPRFTLEVTDSATGTPLKDGCYDQNYIAAPGLPGFYDTITPTNIVVRYKPWTKSVLNISGAAGQTVKLTITTGDCSLGGHFGYGYFDLIDCGEFKAVVVDCNLDREGIVLTAPEGYMTYNWWDQNYTQIVDTGRIVKYFPNNTNTQSYHVEMIPYPSVSNCPDTLTTIPLANISLDPLGEISCAEPNTGIQLNANAQGGVGALTYQWTELNVGTLSCTNCSAPTATNPTSNIYTVKVTDDNGCFRTKTINVGINDNTIDAIDDFVFCHPGYTQLDLQITGSLPLTPTQCGANTTGGCASSKIYEVRTLHTEPLLQNYGDTSTMNNPFGTQHSSGHIQYLLKKEDMYYSGLRYGTLSSIGFDVEDVGIPTIDSFTISLTCTDRSSIGGIFEATSSVVYTAPAPFVPVAGWNDFTLDVPFDWDTAKSLLVDICYTVSAPDTLNRTSIAILKTGSIEAIADNTNSNGSSICLGARAEQTAFYSGRPVTRLGWCPSPVKPFEYTWTPGLYLSDSTAKDPLAYITETTKFYVTSVGGSDCPIIDSVTVTVPIHDYTIYPTDTSVCLYEPFQLVAGGTFSAVHWYEYDEATNTFTVPTSLSCDGCDDPNKIPNPIAMPPLDTSKYALVFIDKDNCEDTLYMDYEIRPLPPVEIINNDTIIKYGSDIMLLATGGYLYTWTPSATLSNPNIVNPMASPKEPTLYYVYGIGENGCKKIDSVMVDIDYSSNLFVPTAFTPNGDGKNDVFRVSNITFQRLQEFKVFNRWGQEIFSTTDIKQGWDGSWRGQPQDMGVYHYIIKLATPEGKIETYKGDVMLVR